MALSGIIIASAIIMGVNAAENSMIIRPANPLTTASRVITSTRTITSVFVSTTFLPTTTQEIREPNANLTLVGETALSPSYLSISLENTGSTMLTITMLSLVEISPASSSSRSLTQPSSAMSNNTSRTVSTSPGESGGIQGGAGESAGVGSLALGPEDLAKNVTAISAIATFLILKNGSLLQDYPPASSPSPINASDIGQSVPPGRSANLSFSHHIVTPSGSNSIMPGQEFSIQVVEEPVGAIATFPVIASP